MKANKTKKNNKCSFKNITRKRVLKEHILNKSFDLFNIHYEEPVKKDMAIGLVYFNSAKSKRLLMNFLYTIEKFKMANIPTYTIEMYMTTPEIKDAIHVKTDFILFQKERLCHILEKHIPEKYTKLLFIDADLVFDNLHWYTDLSNKLNTTNIVQPFTNALWLDITYKKIVKQRPSIVLYLKVGDINKYNHGGIWGYHPGFAWGFQRDWFRKCGFYQHGILGDGDTLSATSWIDKSFHDEFLDKRPYQRNALTEYVGLLKVRPSVCYIKGNIYHLWHGDGKKRQYRERRTIFKSVKDIRDIVDVEPSGLFRLKDDSLKPRIMKYFRDRDDDGI